jgi:hypothetical protein
LAEVLIDDDLLSDSGSSSNGEFAYTADIDLYFIQLSLEATYSVDKAKVYH